MMVREMKFVPLLIFQLILMVLFFVFVRHGKDGKETRDSTTGFEDTHVMIFIGFGFLMTFLQKYGYSATGINLLLAAVAIQWALICQNAYHLTNGTIFITKKNLLESDIMSATVLITFGALLGVASCLQLLVVAVVEIAVATFNLYLIDEVFKTPDVGGSMAIHAFGAYFGLGVSLGLRKKKTQAEGEAVPAENTLNGPTYISDITAMIGTLFLWIYWPSFNSALTRSDPEYQRAIVNTYLSLAAATVTTFVMSSLVSHNQGKFDMVHVQNSTLAGGVAVGSVCNLMVSPGGAIAIGIGAGVISVLGYRYLTPKLAKMGVLDTCGVNNLHGMPGVYSGLISIVMAAVATKDLYGNELDSVYRAMGDGRTAGTQALFQLAALACTVGLAFVTGSITGFFARLNLFKGLQETEKYNDEIDWELPK